MLAGGVFSILSAEKVSVILSVLATLCHICARKTGSVSGNNSQAPAAVEWQ